MTYAQAYCASAKIARVTDSGHLPAYVVRRGFQDGGRRLRALGREARQHLVDLLRYMERHVKRRHVLRIEEVLTLDALHEDNVSHAIERHRVFQVGLCYVTRELFHRRLIHRMRGWRRHASNTIGDDLAYLCAVASDDDMVGRSRTWVVPPATIRAIRAQFRTEYFVHGQSLRTNYKIARIMFARETEACSRADDQVLVRPLDDDEARDPYDYPIFTALLAPAELTAVQHVWRATCALWSARRERREKTTDDEDQNAIRLIAYLYATWGYSRITPTNRRSRVFCARDRGETILSRERFLGVVERARRNDGVTISKRRRRSPSTWCSTHGHR